VYFLLIYVKNATENISNMPIFENFLINILDGSFSKTWWQKAISLQTQKLRKQKQKSQFEKEDFETRGKNVRVARTPCEFPIV
jgi:ketol-acid reductoisomerase